MTHRNNILKFCFVIILLSGHCKHKENDIVLTLVNIFGLSTRFFYSRLEITL